MADEPESEPEDDAGDEQRAGDRERPVRDEHGRFVTDAGDGDDSDEEAVDDASADDASADDASADDTSEDATDTTSAADEPPDGDDAADTADDDAIDTADGDTGDELTATGDSDADDGTDEDDSDTETDHGTDEDDSDNEGGRLRPADEDGNDRRRDGEGPGDDAPAEPTDVDDDDDGDGDSDDGDDGDDVHDSEYVEDASIDDDFPVEGMSADDVAWDPEETSDPENLRVEPDEVSDETVDGPVGVQPEKQEIDDSFWGEGPDSDQEMPLADHIEEMMRRLGVVFVIAGAVSLLVLGLAQTIDWLPSAVDIIDLLWNHNIPGAPEQADRRPRIYGPLELILTKLKVAGLAGLLVGLPAFVYETYLFMRPGLYPRERKYYLAAVPTSLVLAIIGMTFAHFVVLPTIFSYFTTYTTETDVTVAFGLAETFNLIVLLMGYMAIVFQIPLFIMLAIWMNLVTRIWLEDKRLLFWGGFAGLAFLVSPDPTGMAPIIIAATMIVLYEGTLALLRWTGN